LVSCRGKYDLEIYSECVRVEITIGEGKNFLTDKHYFSPDIKRKLLLTIFATLKIFWTVTIFRLLY
jgi:hypothetical protein